MASTPLHVPFNSPLHLPFTSHSSPPQLPTVTHPHTPWIDAPLGGGASSKSGGRETGGRDRLGTDGPAFCTHLQFRNSAMPKGADQSPIRPGKGTGVGSKILTSAI